MQLRHPFALNPIQWLASDDGWLDFTRQLDPALLLAEIKSVGYDAVFAGVPGVSSTAQLRRLLDATQLEPAPGYLSLGLPGEGVETAALVERARQVARDHANLGLSDLVVAAGMSQQAPRVRRPACGYEADPERLSRLAEVLARVAEATLAEGVRPALHPHVGTWIETEDEARDLLERFGAETLGFCPDTGHLSWAGADVVGLIEEYGDRIPVVHVKDCRLSVAASAREAGSTYQQAVMAGLWAEPGQGDLELEAMLARLPDPYPGWMIVEVDRPAATSPLESAAISARWMSSFTGPAAGAVLR